MLAVRVIAVGRLGERYLADACAEYAKRLGALFRLTVEEIGEEKLPADPSDKQVHRGLEAEGRRIMEKITARAFVIALCVEGKAMDSERFSRLLQDTAQTHSEVAVVIGSSHGLCESVKKAAHLRLSVSQMTFPHQLCRVMVMEQLYRAGMIAAGRRYHK